MSMAPSLAGSINHLFHLLMGRTAYSRPGRSCKPGLPSL